METKIYMVFENESVEFKSYYVVWKREKSVDEVEIIDRLNRTM